MIDFHFRYNQQPCSLKDSIPEGTEEHGFFVADMFDDVRSDPGGDGEGEIYE